MKKKYFKIFIVFIALFMFLAIPKVSAADDKDFIKTTKYVACGDGIIKKMPSQIPDFTKRLYDLAMVVTPIILIVMGTIDLTKGIMSGKEEEMKKGRETFIKRLIVGLIVFLVALITKFAVSVVAGNNSNYVRIIGCLDCFLEGSSSCK
jgi:hypothetical protein